MIAALVIAATMAAHAEQLPPGQQALIGLLSDARAEVAALSARVMAIHRIECAVPALLRLLSDSRVYAGRQSSISPRAR